MLDLTPIRAVLREFRIDAWILYDFRGSNILARRILGLDDVKTSRRFACCIPADGEPLRLVHRIEDNVLDGIPGEKLVYLRWQELEQGFARIAAGRRVIAMEYSPRNGNPYVSRVDAGVVELVRSFGSEVVSSGDLVQQFEATWDDDQWAMHLAASKVTDESYCVAWDFIRDAIQQRGGVDEREVQQAILDHFARHNLTTYSPPIVARAEHSGLPHYETGAGSDTRIREGDLVLIDLWGKLDQPRAVYSDLTRVGYVGMSVPEKYEQVFRIVASARDAGIACVRGAFAHHRPLRGFEVDDAVRDVVHQAGYGDAFCHRTGHNIGQEVHGNGANMDNLETREERLVLRRTCFSIEPGIYLEEFGVRSEVDVYIDAQGTVHVTGGAPQSHIIPILAAT